jgi:hypothetical protein
MGDRLQSHLSSLKALLVMPPPRSLGPYFLSPLPAEKFLVTKFRKPPKVVLLGGSCSGGGEERKFKERLRVSDEVKEAGSQVSCQ